MSSTSPMQSRSILPRERAMAPAGGVGSSRVLQRGDAVRAREAAKKLSGEGRSAEA